MFFARITIGCQLDFLAYLRRISMLMLFSFLHVPGNLRATWRALSRRSPSTKRGR
jgi:hypothetical protein